MAIINGVDVEKIKQTQEQVKKDRMSAEREPKIVGRWLGGSETEIKFGDVTTKIGGAGNLNAMQTFLAALAACDIDLIAMNAALVGLSIDELWIEASGHFNTSGYYGVEDTAGPGYDRISYVVHLKAPGATPEQIAFLKERCERGSPVGDSISKAIPLSLNVETAQ